MNAHTGPHVGGLDEQWIPQLERHFCGVFGVRTVARANQQAVVHLWNSSGLKHLLGHHLVHTDGAAQHATAHKRNARQGEQALNRAVLTVWAVQQWKDHLEFTGPCHTLEHQFTAPLYARALEQGFSALTRPQPAPLLADEQWRDLKLVF